MLETLRSCGTALALAAVVAGCSSDPILPKQPGTAELRVVHASPAVGDIDVRVAQVSVVSGLGYGRSSGVLRVPSGTQVITVQSGGAQIAQFSANLASDHGNALTVGEDTTQVSRVIPDTGFAVSNRANIRLINVVGATTADPTLLHLRLRFPDIADSTAVIGLDAKVASHGPMMYFNPGHFSASFVAQGSAVVLAQAEFDVAAGMKAAIVLERSSGGTYAVRIITEP